MLTTRAPLRGEAKLRAALSGFGVGVTGRVCLDLGAAAGGFTRVLLEAGAARVYAVDAGFGQLLGSLRQDPRVVNLEATNVAALDTALVPDAIELVTIDVSYLALAAAVRCHGLLWTHTDARSETTAGGQTELIAGVPTLDERIGRLDLRISPEAFFQTNTEMAERLYELIVESAALRGWECVYDLYCGIGSIGLSLASRAGTIHGLEVVEEAVADAIANARLNEITNASFYAGDVRLALGELVARAGRPDLVVVDPPRAGLSQKIVRRLIEASPKRIVYVSCNPTTLAPNAAQLVEAGWRLERVTPVDMFPQTPHIECVAVLSR